MSYALVPVERYHPVVRLPRGARVLPQIWAAAGLGGFPGLPTADNFWFDETGYFYVYTWTPQQGWNAGQWVVGFAGSPNLNSVIGPAPSNAWFAIFDAHNKLVVIDRQPATAQAAAFHLASWAPPGTSVAV